MEVDSPVSHHVARRVWNLLRLAFLMFRKGSAVKKKMMLEVHLMMKRGKVLGKTVMRNLIFNHSGGRSPYGYGLKEYEFSCSNSPTTPFNFIHKRKHQAYFPSIPRFPCIQPHPIEDEPDESWNYAIVLSQKLDCNGEFFGKNNFDVSDFPIDDVDESRRPLSPFGSTHLSSSAEDIEDQVDRQAEEFISKFYDQIRLQRQMSMVQYDEMLARGAR